MKSPSKRPVLIVDDDEEMILGLRYMLSDDFMIQDARSGIDALQKAKGGNFAVVILDLVMDDISGIETLQQLKELNEFQKVIILTGHVSEEFARSAVNSGAFKYLLKPPPAATLKQAIDEAFERYDREAGALIEPTAEDFAELGLTPREAEIALQVSSGKINDHIAEELSINHRTVEKHLEAIYKKLRISGKAARTQLAIQLRDLAGKARSKRL